MIALLGRAQAEDGYLNTYYTVKEPNKRWTNVRERLCRSVVDDHVKPVKMKAIPYYAWCNREPGEMLVWINEGR